VNCFQRVGSFSADAHGRSFRRVKGHQVKNTLYVKFRAVLTNTTVGVKRLSLFIVFSKIYSEHGQPARAIEIIEDALSANPDSAALSAYVASMYLENKDYRQAEIFLDKAERLDPELEAIPMFRQVLKWEKVLDASKADKLSEPKPKKKKRKR